MIPDGHAEFRVPGSFRDPRGFMFVRDGLVYRQIQTSGRESYELLQESGLYDALVERQWLIPHSKVSADLSLDNSRLYKVIQPEKIPYLSWPYEWCFSQLKDAALLTLEIQKLAMEHGMTLRDASAYNLQFFHGRPVFIDTLSFDKYESGPWLAYKQFCEHFLAPLALKAKTHQCLGQLLKTNVDGIPLDLASKLLPWHSYLDVSLLGHIHLHAKSQRHYADKSTAGTPANNTMSREKLAAFIDQLMSTVNKLKAPKAASHWNRYYSNNSYSSEAMAEKQRLVTHLLEKSTGNGKLPQILDLGANDGHFSRLAARFADIVVAMDADESTVEAAYLQNKQGGHSNILPLVQDLTNPSPAIGWACEERESLLERSPSDMVMALALVHHLAIANNLPLDMLARFFSHITPRLIIEFVPKEDPQVQRLLQNREDVFPEYEKNGFEFAFSKYFFIDTAEQIPGSDRWLYLMTRMNIPV